MTDTIKAAALALASARQNAEAASAALTEAQAAADEPKARVAALQAERAGIISASRGGKQDPAKALRMACIDEDVADLAPIVAEADGDVAKASGAAQEAQQAAVRAEQQMAAAVEDDMALRLAEHAGQLDALLLKTLSDMAAIAKRGARRPFWAPTPALVIELQRLHLTANGIRR
jgi:hypothetical protein